MGEWIFHSKYILLHEWIMDKFNWEFYVFKWGKLLKGLPIGLNNKNHLNATALIFVFIKFISCWKSMFSFSSANMPHCILHSRVSLRKHHVAILYLWSLQYRRIFCLFSIVFWNHIFLAVWNNTVDDAIVWCHRIRHHLHFYIL